MSALTANTILPLISALPDSEKRVLADHLKALLNTPAKRDSKKPPKGYKNIPEKFWPQNQEMLIHDILHGKSS
jgi:hypothetical protein